MANANRPSGLSPVGYLNGAPWNGQGRTYWIKSDDTNAYAIGDPMVLSGTASPAGVAGVTLATAASTNMVLGALVGMGGTVNGAMFGDPTNLNTTVIPAVKTKDYYVMIADDPNIIFEIQEIGTGTQLTVTAVGLNASLVAGTNNGYVSGWMLANDDEATTSTLQLKLLGLTQRLDNAFGAYAKWQVLINNHIFKAGQNGI